MLLFYFFVAQVSLKSTNFFIMIGKPKSYLNNSFLSASIYRSILFLASVHVILWVCFTAVIAEWTLDFFGKLLNLCMVYLSFTLAVVHSIKKIICSFKKVWNEVPGPNQRIALLKCGPLSKQKWYTIKAGRRSWGTTLLSRKRTELSKTISYPSEKKNEHIKCVLKNIETIITRTNVEQTKVAWKKR